jgi:ubiquinone/menaquinone biosynthesis C-methylase UbiE
VVTGMNISYHPPNSTVVAIDLIPRMLERARRLAARLRADVTLVEMDAEHLDYTSHIFDWAVATFVFCSTPDR